ncbi:hypothetical protein G9U52_00980 [Paenibacillus sp. S3N08]|uniref:Uncharacterized protein n=1 Tax=Paenibacillus agricola TaxID=2716264 RepID=A0ABX0J003_9BACL|nr:hypothetical protein [Paenibacillus agricola]
MSRYAYSELRKISNEDERMRLLMEEINRMMKAKKKLTFIQKLISKRPTTKPRAW